MTLKELLDKKRGVVGRRLLVNKITIDGTMLDEVTIKEVSESKKYVKVCTPEFSWSCWFTVEDFDLGYKIIEILKG